MMMDVSISEAKGVRYMGMLPKPKKLKLATPVAARIVIQLHTCIGRVMQQTCLLLSRSSTQHAKLTRHQAVHLTAHCDVK